MSVWKRVLIKTVVLAFVIVLFGAGAAGWQAYRQSTPEYAMDKYIALLIENSGEKAYALLDQSEDAAMTSEEYETALAEKKYSLFASYDVTASEKRRDQSGNEYVDYRTEFKDADGAVQMEETFTVKKQAEPLFGVFDQWKVLSGLCMVKDFVLTVPAGAEVYLDGRKADASWLIRDGVLPSYDCYQIPSLLPGRISLAIRHPAFDSVNGTIDPLDGSAEYGEKMALGQAAQDVCKELSIKALKQLYSCAAREKTEDLEDLLGECLEEAKLFVKEQGQEFHKDSAVFKSAGITDFAVQFGAPVFTGEATGAITVPVKLSYRYIVRENVTSEPSDEQGDEEESQEGDAERPQVGTVVQDGETQVISGDNTAQLVMAWHHDAWHIASMEIPVIPK